MFKIAKILIIGLLFSSAAIADGHEHHGERGREHHRPVQYAPAPRYYSDDQRSTQGLLGGVIGSAAGYEISRGNPLGAGLGAAAGAWVGNGMAR